MEQVYDPDFFSATDTINLSEYFTKYSEICPQIQKRNKSNLETIRKEMSRFLDKEISKSEVEQLDKLCSIDKLLCDDEGQPVNIPQKLQHNGQIEPCYLIDNSGGNLKINECRKYFPPDKDMESSISNYSKRHFRIYENQPLDVHRSDINPGSDYMLKISFYKPFLSIKDHAVKCSNLCFDFEIEALGSSLLSSIEKIINCVNDKVIYKEVESPLSPPDEVFNSREVYPSRFFFIGDTFYNDMSHPNSVDISKVIRDWAQKKEIAEFRTASMNEIKLNQLQFRLGYPYVFIHQGNCEHIFQFSDAQLLQLGHCLQKSAYPRVSSVVRLTRAQCNVCNILSANWLCTGSDRFQQNNVLLCTDCCLKFNYIDGEKVGKFKLYAISTED